MFPIIGLFLSCIYLHLIRLRLKRTLFQRYHNSITDSTANGKNNVFVFIGFVLFILLFIVGSLQRSLGIWDDKVSNDMSSGAFSYSYYIFTAIATFSTSPIFILNVEFKNFLLRRMGQYFIFNKRTYFRTPRNKICSTQKEETIRQGKEIRQISGRRSEFKSRIIPEDQQQRPVCNENKSQLNPLVDREPRDEKNIRSTTSIILVKEAKQFV